MEFFSLFKRGWFSAVPESSSAEHPSTGSSLPLWFLVVIIIGLIVRAYLVVFTPGTNDVWIWENHAKGINQLGLINYYHAATNPLMNHPPFISICFAWLLKISDATGIPFRILLRTPFALLDLGTALLLISAPSAISLQLPYCGMLLSTSACDNFFRLSRKYRFGHCLLPAASQLVPDPLPTITCRRGLGYMPMDQITGPHWPACLFLRHSRLEHAISLLGNCWTRRHFHLYTGHFSGSGHHRKKCFRLSRPDDPDHLRNSRLGHGSDNAFLSRPILTILATVPSSPTDFLDSL